MFGATSRLDARELFAERVDTDADVRMQIADVPMVAD